MAIARPRGEAQEYLPIRRPFAGGRSITLAVADRAESDRTQPRIG